jgi:RNA polymerase sigma factor (sigma-70 family)
MREHRAMVFSVAYHFLHDRELAEEIAQDVFLSLHTHLAELESPAHAGFWLRKVAVQRSIDASRRRNRRPQVALDDVAEPSVKPSAGDHAGRMPPGLRSRRWPNAAHGMVLVSEDLTVGDCRDRAFPGHRKESHSTVAGLLARS